MRDAVGPDLADDDVHVVQPGFRGALAQGGRGALPVARGDARAHAHHLAAAAQRAAHDRLLRQQGVGELDRGAVVAAQTRVGQPELLDDALEPVDVDAIAQPDGLAEREHDARDHVRERALRGQPDHDRDDRGRREDGAGVVLRGLELPQHHACDEHDRDRHPEPQECLRPCPPRGLVARQALNDALHG